MPRKKKQTFFSEALPDLPLSERARLAEEALKNPIFKIVVEKAQKELFESFKATSVRDTEGREALFFRVEALSKILTELQGTISEAVYEQKTKGEKNG